MNDYATGIVTKGILGDSLATKGFVILEITEIPIRKRRGGFFPSKAFPIQPKKFIKVKFIYKGKVYQSSKIVDQSLKIGIKNIDIKVVDGKPKVKFKILNNE